MSDPLTPPLPGLPTAPEAALGGIGDMADTPRDAGLKQAPAPRNEKAPADFGYVGIDSILEQMRRKAMKQGFEFNIMVVGECAPRAGTPHRGLWGSVCSSEKRGWTQLARRADGTWHHVCPCACQEGPGFHLRRRGASAPHRRNPGRPGRCSVRQLADQRPHPAVAQPWTSGVGPAPHGQQARLEASWRPQQSWRDTRGGH